MAADPAFPSLPTLITPKRPKAPPRKREKIPPPSLPMEYPPTIPELLDELGGTHAEAGALVGLSRSQTSNVIVGRVGAGQSSSASWNSLAPRRPVRPLRALTQKSH